MYLSKCVECGRSVEIVSGAKELCIYCDPEAQGPSGAWLTEKGEKVASACHVITYLKSKRTWSVTWGKKMEVLLFVLSFLFAASICIGVEQFPYAVVGLLSGVLIAFMVKRSL